MFTQGLNNENTIISPSVLGTDNPNQRYRITKHETDYIATYDITLFASKIKSLSKDISFKVKSYILLRDANNGIDLTIRVTPGESSFEELGKFNNDQSGFTQKEFSEYFCINIIPFILKNELSQFLRKFLDDCSSKKLPVSELKIFNRFPGNVSEKFGIQKQDLDLSLSIDSAIKEFSSNIDEAYINQILRDNSFIVPVSEITSKERILEDNGIKFRSRHLAPALSFKEPILDNIIIGDFHPKIHIIAELIKNSYSPDKHIIFSYLPNSNFSSHYKITVEEANKRIQKGWNLFDIDKSEGSSSDVLILSNEEYTALEIYQAKLLEYSQQVLTDTYPRIDQTNLVINKKLITTQKVLIEDKLINFYPYIEVRDNNLYISYTYNLQKTKHITPSQFDDFLSFKSYEDRRNEEITRILQSKIIELGIQTEYNLLGLKSHPAVKGYNLEIYTNDQTEIVAPIFLVLSNGERVTRFPQCEINGSNLLISFNNKQGEAINVTEEVSNNFESAITQIRSKLVIEQDYLPIDPFKVIEIKSSKDALYLKWDDVSKVSHKDDERIIYSIQYGPNKLYNISQEGLFLIRLRCSIRDAEKLKVSSSYKWDLYQTKVAEQLENELLIVRQIEEENARAYQANQLQQEKERIINKYTTKRHYNPILTCSDEYPLIEAEFLKLSHNRILKPCTVNLSNKEKLTFYPYVGLNTEGEIYLAFSSEITRENEISAEEFQKYLASESFQSREQRLILANELSKISPLTLDYEVDLLKIEVAPRYNGLTLEIFIDKKNTILLEPIKAKGISQSEFVFVPYAEYKNQKLVIKFAQSQIALERNFNQDKLLEAKKSLKKATKLDTPNSEIKQLDTFEEDQDSFSTIIIEKSIRKHIPIEEVENAFEQITTLSNDLYDTVDNEVIDYVVDFITYVDPDKKNHNHIARKYLDIYSEKTNLLNILVLLKEASNRILNNQINTEDVSIIIAYEIIRRNLVKKKFFGSEGSKINSEISFIYSNVIAGLNNHFEKLGKLDDWNRAHSFMIAGLSIAIIPGVSLNTH